MTISYLISKIKKIFGIHGQGRDAHDKPECLSLRPSNDPLSRDANENNICNESSFPNVMGISDYSDGLTIPISDRQQQPPYFHLQSSFDILSHDTKENCTFDESSFANPSDVLDHSCRYISPVPNIPNTLPVNVRKCPSNETGEGDPMNKNVGHLELENTTFIEYLNKNTAEKRNILNNLNAKTNYNDSHIRIEHLDPDKCHLEEKAIIYYPKLFETDAMNSKFLTRTLISASKLSNIYLCKHRFNSQYYVVKSGCDSNNHTLSESSREILNEIKILTMIGKHIHVVDFYDAWIEDEKFYLQLGHIKGGSLFDFIGGNTCRFEVTYDTWKTERKFKISNSSAYVLLAHMSSVLVYMHETLDIFHGDIKPSNILFDMVKYTSSDMTLAKQECHSALLGLETSKKLRFKLCDFGRSGATVNVSKMDEGDGRYLPAFNDDCSNHHLFATSRDIYSLGLTIYESLGGEINPDSAREIRNGNWKKMPETIPTEWQNIIKAMSHTNEVIRHTARTILDLDKVKGFILPEAQAYFNY